MIPTFHSIALRRIASLWVCALSTAVLCAAPSAPVPAIDPRQVPADARLSRLDNGTVTVAVDLNRGGAMVYLSRNGGSNLINNFDLGRQVQMSFYSGPVPFEADGQKPAKHWEHIGWNPIQSGDDFKNRSLVLAHQNDGRTIHVTCRPLQWPLNKVYGDCTFDSWVELDGSVVKVRSRLNNARTDHTQYPARLQELPAVYANAAFHRVVSYTGARPFTGDAISAIPKAVGKHPWSFWNATENWSALLDERDQGLGLITPGRVHFTGGFAGSPGPNDTFHNFTGYLAGQGMEILDHNIVYEFRYELVAGSLKEIRDRAASVRVTGLPAWTFTRDRRGWHYRNASDGGWPVAGLLDIRLDRNDPQLISPHTLWQAVDAPYLIIEAAFRTKHRTGTVYWQPLEKETNAASPTSMSFPIQGDGQFRRLVIRLADNPGYRGALTGLRIDPVPAGESGDWVKVRSIRLSSEP